MAVSWIGIPHHTAGLFLPEKGQNQLRKAQTMHFCACNLAIDITRGILYLQHTLGPPAMVPLALQPLLIWTLGYTEVSPHLCR